MKKKEIKKTGEIVYYKKLDNGLEIYLLPNHKVKNFYITLSTKFGSLHTDFTYQKKSYKQPKGMAHFLEHLVFNMPDGKSAFDYYAKIGSSINAYTSFDITSYEVFANNKFKKNLSYLLEYVYTPYFNTEMVTAEKEIITEEIKQIGDNPDTELVFGLYHNLFIKDQHQYLISGTIKDVAKISLDDVKTAYEAFYHPENMFLIITGNFKPEEAVAITSETLKDFEFKKYNPPIIKEIKEPFKIKEEFTTKTMPVEKHKVSLGFKIPKNNFKALKLDDLELRIYINLIIGINFGATSLLREELISNGIITTSIDYSLMLTDEYIIINFAASTEYPDYFEKRIKEKFKSIKVTKEEIERKTRNAISNLIMSFDNIEAVNADIQDDILEYGEYITNVADYFKRINAETASKVIEKFNKHLVTVMVLNPKEEI